MARQPEVHDEITIVERLLKKHRRPPSVKEVKIDLGEDLTGDPAVWISLIVENDLNPSEAKLAELDTFSDTIRTEILQHGRDQGLSRYPYVRYRAAA